MAYVELAGLIKGYWRRRSFDYTASSSPTLTAGTRAYNTPTPSGAVFDSVGRLGFRRSGAWADVPVLGDAEWLEKSSTRTTDAGEPQFARLVQTASATQIELNRPISQNFIDSISALTLEYHIAIAHLSADTDTTVLPRNRVHLILPLAVWYYGMGQGDFKLANGFEKKAEWAKAEMLRHDLTRTGRPRQLRPTYSYTGQRGRVVSRDYGSN